MRAPTPRVEVGVEPVERRGVEDGAVELDGEVRDQGGVTTVGSNRSGGAAASRCRTVANDGPDGTRAGSASTMVAPPHVAREKSRAKVTRSGSVCTA